MAHEIRSTDKFAEVRSGGKRAWHGLGIEIPDNLTAVEAVDRTGLGWSTELLPVYADRMTADGVERIESPAHRLHVRSDTKRVFGVVSDGYVPVNNRDLAVFADSIVGDDAVATVETVGSLFDGQRVFILLRLPKVIQAARGDEVNCYLAVTNGHGGVASLSAYPTSVRIVCRNTQRLSEKDLNQGVRCLHTGDLAGKMRTAKLTLGFAAREFDRLDAQVKAMVAKRLTAEEFKAFMANAFAAVFPRPDANDAKNAEAIAKWETKREETFADWRAIYATERNQIAGIRGSVWQAFNVVTEWHDHSRGRYAADSDARTASNLFGVSHTAKAKTLKLALATAGA